MIKKFLFISIICCLFFKPIHVFSADYDEDDTEIIMNAENPFADTQFCGFEKLKQWFGLKEKQQKKFDEENEKKFKIAQKVYLEYKFKGIGTLDEAKSLFMEGAQKACPKSMESLGTLKVEQGDNAPEEEKQKYYNDAFSWYVISFWMQVIKEVKLNQIIRIPTTIVSKLENLVKKSCFCKKRILCFDYIKNFEEKHIGSVLLSIENINKSFFDARFFNVAYYIGTSFLHAFPCDRKLTIFTINLLNWKLYLSDKRLKSKSEELINLLAALFYKNKFLHESAHCWRNPIEQNHISLLAKLILNGLRNSDQNGIKFKEIDRNKIGSRLFWSVKSYNKNDNNKFMVRSIQNGYIKFDSNGKNITEKNKYIILSDLYKALNTPESLHEIGMCILKDKLLYLNNKLILPDEKYESAANFFRKSLSHSMSSCILGLLIQNGLVKKDLNGLEFLEEQRYEIAADLFRQSTSIPQSLFSLGHLIERGEIKKDLYNQDICDGQQYVVAADLYRQSRSEPMSLFYLGHLIEEGKVDQDLDNNNIQEGKRNEIASSLYRKSKTSSALNRLACLIFCKKTSEDLDGNLVISDSQRNEIALKLFLDSDSGDAYYNLAIVKLLSPSGESLEAKKEALTFLMKAALEGIENAATYYEILKNEIEVEQNPFGISDQLVSEIKKEDSILDNMSENERLQNEEINSANNDSVDDTYEVKSDCDIVKSSNVIENADIKEKIVLSTAESSEELSILKRKELKALKKKQREQKKKDLGNKFKKLLRGQLSEQEKTSFISKQKMNIAKKDIKVTFDKNAQKEWVALDVFKRDKVSELIADIKIGGKRGKPEQLVNSDAFSRRITGKHRLIYQIENNDNIKILSCQGHYDD